MSEETEEYNASKIVVLEGAQGIRKRPAMYIGSTGSAGVLHLLYEVVDNAVDEAIAGYCKNIHIRLFQEEGFDAAEVSDDGRGIPVDIMPKYNKNALEIIMTTLHKGAKFSDEVYKISGGLHGVGLTVVNALSVYTEVKVRKEGSEYYQRFEKGLPVTGLEKRGNAEGSGTTVRFRPDPEIFGSPKFDSTTLRERLSDTTFLNRNLRIILVDERFEQREETVFYSENGLVDFIGFLNKEKQVLTPPIYSKSSGERAEVEYVIQYNSSYDERIESFVNTIKTTGGGTHVSGFHSGLTRAVLNYISRNKLSDRYKDLKITGDDVREGLSAVVSVNMQNPEFEGQTKEKLGNGIIKNFVEAEVYSFVSRYFEEHPQLAKAIIEKAVNAANVRESARKAREMARKRSILDDTVLPGKLADCIESDPDKTEIFIVEGQSAGGSSKEGRDRNIQAILPLRGKILNVEKAGFERIFDNLEIKSMIASFGTGISESFNAEKVRYKKIIIMSDADVDGSHIRTLLLTFFYRYMKKLIELGYVYIAQPPLFKVSKGKEISYHYSEEELSLRIKELGGNVDVQRYKGLGEMNPEQLWDTTMNPEHRILKRVTIKDAQMADSLFSILMGIDPAQRRKFLHDNAEQVTMLDI
jgi:DNA gyrase subunit B